MIFSLFENTFLSDKVFLAIKMLKRGYIFTKEDELLVNSLSYELKYKQTLISLFAIANNLDDKSLIDKLFEHSTLFCTIESAKRGEIIGFGYKPNEWIAFANNAIHSYKEYWEYIEIAFKQYGIWEKLISLDKNGTFQKKLNIYYSEKPLQRFDCDMLFSVSKKIA
ncbi:MAG: hypothetical protein HC905_00975 [Bacteroidales bacterium]|nr:hypothetical protein [Bacteroidales bacterium]